MSSAKGFHEGKMALGSAGGQRDGLGELGKGKPRQSGMMQERLIKKSVSNGRGRDLRALSKAICVCVE